MTKPNTAVAQSKATKIELSLDLCTIGAGYATQHIGDDYTAKTGKSKGQVLKRKANKVMLPKLADLTSIGLSADKARAKRNQMGLDLKAQAAKLVNAAANDARIICTGIGHTIDGQGNSRVGIALMQTTSQKLYASLIAHGVPAKQAKLFAARYE